METYEVCHGTDEDCAQQILSGHQFRVSDSDTEWAGTGVYFFQGADADKHAYSWASLYKKYANPCVLQAKIELEPGNILNLDDSSQRTLFHQYRKAYFEQAYLRAKKIGISWNDLKNQIGVAGKLDCAVINQICSLQPFHAVIKSVYISCLEGDVPAVFRYPASFTPNCTILCLRRQDRIMELSKLILNGD